MVLALVTLGAVSAAFLLAVTAGAVHSPGSARTALPDLPENVCGPAARGQPPLLKTLVAAKTGNGAIGRKRGDADAEQSARAAFRRA